MKVLEIFKKGTRRWVFFGRDETHSKGVIDTNQYLVSIDGKGLLPDPGGVETFPGFMSALSKEISMEDIEALFGSHQDPDIISSLALWLVVAPDTKVYVPGIWTGFIKHFAEDGDLTAIPDEGMTLPLGLSNDLQLIPAHYVHSSANFSLYDPEAKILFSGDIGAALLPEGHTDVFAENFDRHVQYMEGFHRRWLPSNDAKNDWVRRVRLLDIDMICPQHGSIIRGEDVERFLDWLEALEVAGALDYTKEAITDVVEEEIPEDEEMEIQAIPDA